MLTDVNFPSMCKIPKASSGEVGQSVPVRATIPGRNPWLACLPMAPVAGGQVPVSLELRVGDRDPSSLLQPFTVSSRPVAAKTVGTWRTDTHTQAHTQRLLAGG